MNKAPTPEQVAWQKGYDLGVSVTLDRNDAALQIGQAILAVLDNRYGFAKQDY